MKINSRKIIKYNRTQSELELLLIFAVFVAGKTSKSIEHKVYDFILGSSFYCKNESPIKTIKKMVVDGSLMVELKRVKLGKYTLGTTFLKQLVERNLDLSRVTLHDLEKLHGVGMKTSRFFLLASRRSAKCAALDTHVLKWLSQMGHKNVPKVTPSSKKIYLHLEKQFLHHAKLLNMSPADLDLAIWNHYSSGKEYLWKKMKKLDRIPPTKIYLP